MLHLPHKMTTEISKMLRVPRKPQLILEKRRKSIAPATQNDFRHVTKHFWINVRKCHACHAKRSNTTCETSKSDPFCRTYHRHGHTALTRTVVDGCERLRTVANGGERMRTVADGCGRLGNVERTPSTPRPPEWNGNPCYAFGKEATQ